MYKKFLSILFVSLMLFSSCSSKTADTSSDQKSSMAGNCSKASVAEFMQVFGTHELGGLLSGLVLDEKHCYNVTPEQIEEMTSAQIFKFSDSCATFLYLDGQVYPFGDWFGGFGFVNAVPCDFDEDGNWDILYTYSWGSGLHRSLIAVFNTQTKQSTVLHDSLETNTPRVDYYIGTQSPSTDIPGEITPTYYAIYTAEIEVLEDNFANLAYTLTGTAGSIKSENGIPVFYPTNS